jgi:hypothetical protein
MAEVVETHADDFPRAGNHRPQFYPGDRNRFVAAEGRIRQQFDRAVFAKLGDAVDRNSEVIVDNSGELFAVVSA